MVDVVKNNLTNILFVCQQMKLKSLYLFGSAARENDFKKESDLDFLVQFINGADGLPVGDYDYLDLLFKLEEITGKKVDLVAEERISNKYFLERVSKEKLKIYEA